MTAILAKTCQELNEPTEGSCVAPAGKPRLLALEGPAGAGKTTLLDPVLRELERRGLRAHALAEFSSSPLGDSLREGAGFGAGGRASWMCGLAGLLAFLADRVARLENAAVDPEAIYVCDRFLISETALALRAIRPSPERIAGARILRSLLAWARARFAEDSIIVLLDSDQLEGRLQRRLGRDLEPELRARLTTERARYRRLSGLSLGWTIHAVSSDAAPDGLAADLVSWALRAWAR